MPSSQNLQRDTRIVVLRVLRMRGRGLGDPGPDDADMYARVRIDGQPMASAVIHGHDRYSFPDPNEPFTWIKAVPAVPDEGEPVESVEVEVRTGDVRWAGTDDDVYLRLGANLAIPARQARLRRLRARRSRHLQRADRRRGQGRLARRRHHARADREVPRRHLRRLAAGRRQAARERPCRVYSNQSIDRWLENDNRAWTAPNFVRRAPRGTKLPVWLRLAEDDFLYGGDDDGDINPFDRRRTVSVGYAPGPPLLRTTTGGGRLGGRLDDGDEATITYLLETIAPEPIRVSQPPPPGPPPDLVVTAFTYGSVTVRNQGTGPAGPFRLRAANATRTALASFTGLAAGASETRALTGLSCFEAYVATVDDLGQVAEADETNNLFASQPVIC